MALNLNFSRLSSLANTIRLRFSKVHIAAASPSPRSQSCARQQHTMLRCAGLALLALHAAVDAQTVSLRGSGTTNPKKLHWCAPGVGTLPRVDSRCPLGSRLLCVLGASAGCARPRRPPRRARCRSRASRLACRSRLSRGECLCHCRQLGSKLEAMAGQPVDISYRAIGSSSGKAEFLAKTSAYGCAEIPVLESEKTAGAQQKPVLLRRERVCS